MLWISAELQNGPQGSPVQLSAHGRTIPELDQGGCGFAYLRLGTPPRTEIPMAPVTWRAAPHSGEEMLPDVHPKPLKVPSVPTIPSYIIWHHWDVFGSVSLQLFPNSCSRDQLHLTPLPLADSEVASLLLIIRMNNFP